MVLAWSVANFFENYEYFQAVTKQLFSFNFILFPIWSITIACDIDYLIVISCLQINKTIASQFRTI